MTYVTPLFEPLARAGLAWFSIDYRLTPDFTNEDQLEDLRQAVSFVKSQHRRFNIDPRRIFLVGESASGQMVAQLATEDRSLAGVVSFYGVYDFAAMVTDASPRSLLVRLFRRTVLDDDSRAILRKYSPVYQAHKDMPPMLLVNGTGERLWAQAQAFAQRLTELGVDHEVIALDTRAARHGELGRAPGVDVLQAPGRRVDSTHRFGGRLSSARGLGIRDSGFGIRDSGFGIGIRDGDAGLGVRDSRFGVLDWELGTGKLGTETEN